MLLFKGIFNYALPSAGRHPDEIEEKIAAPLSSSASTTQTNSSRPAPTTSSSTRSSGSTRRGMCENQNAGTDPRIQISRCENPNQAAYSPPLGDISGCNMLERGVKRGTMPQEPLPGILDHREFTILNDHSMYCMFQKFEAPVGFRVLTHPAGEIHVNKLAREIGVSLKNRRYPGSVNKEECSRAGCLLHRSP
jgi:hypothetical protein